jgi:hypothetical protein
MSAPAAAAAAAAGPHRYSTRYASLNAEEKEARRAKAVVPAELAVALQRVRAERRALLDIAKLEGGPQEVWDEQSHRAVTAAWRDVGQYLQQSRPAPAFVHALCILLQRAIDIHGGGPLQLNNDKVFLTTWRELIVAQAEVVTLSARWLAALLHLPAAAAAAAGALVLNLRPDSDDVKLVLDAVRWFETMADTVPEMAQLAREPAIQQLRNWETNHYAE